jgi:hypothetical protein
VLFITGSSDVQHEQSCCKSRIVLLGDAPWLTVTLTAIQYQYPSGPLSLPAGPARGSGLRRMVFPDNLGARKTPRLVSQVLLNRVYHEGPGLGLGSVALSGILSSAPDRSQEPHQGAGGPGRSLAEVAPATPYICEVNHKRKWEGCS